MGDESAFIMQVEGVPAGDSVTHPSYGRGVSMGGWEGHLIVRFPSGEKVFGADEGLLLFNGPTVTEWALVSAEDAETLLRERRQKFDTALAIVRHAFQHDFIRSSAVFESGPSSHLSTRLFERERYCFVRDWFSEQASRDPTSMPRLPDEEQLVAIASVDDHVQLIARAGSGKTETIANRAFFLMQHCGISPDEIMLLAFNAEASREMEERIRKKTGGRAVPNVMTFHSLAYNVTGGETTLLKNDGGDDQSLNSFLQAVLDDLMLANGYMDRLRRVMLRYFRSDWKAILTYGLQMDRDEMLLYRRSRVGETLAGEWVKSYGEKVIANFLFEHDVPYQYERGHRWGDQEYRPDFTVPKSGEMERGVIIEYFGLVGDPDYDELAAEKRSYWSERTAKWCLISLCPSDWHGDPETLERCLGKLLSQAGVRLRRMTETEIWERARRLSVLRFTEAVSGFVGLCRKQCLAPRQVRERIIAHEFADESERGFVELAVEVYETYLDRLSANNVDDFDGLMQRAAAAIGNGRTKFTRRKREIDLRRLRYLFIDEYQDFSELFNRVVEAVVKASSSARLFCVGDDWQAINRFAGSDLKFYKSFGTYFQPSKCHELATNYRSGQSIVAVSNALMEGRGPRARSHTQDLGRVHVVALDRFRPTNGEMLSCGKSRRKSAVLRIVLKVLEEGLSVTLLSYRKNMFEPGGRSMPIGGFLESMRACLPEPVRNRLSISTAHGFKGRQSDVIIVLDAMEKSFPFIHPHWVFSRILGESESAIVDDSRRLFYVALTRAKHALYLVTESGRQSPFLAEISKHQALLDIDWAGYPPASSANFFISVQVAGRYDSFRHLIPDLKADGFTYHDRTASGGKRFWSRSLRVERLSDQVITGSPWMVKARELKISEVEIRVLDGHDKIIFKVPIIAGSIIAGSVVMRGGDGETLGAPTIEQLVIKCIGYANES
jgi:DNA helicase-4